MGHNPENTPWMFGVDPGMFFSLSLELWDFKDTTSYIVVAGIYVQKDIVGPRWRYALYWVPF